MLQHIIYIKKSEIKDLIEALRILNVDNPSDLNANTMTIRHLEELLNLESQILRKLMSNAISDEVNVPELSYGDYDIILDNELNDLISALTIILGSKDETIGGLDMGSTTITSVMFANLLNIGVDRDAVNGSHIVTRLISESVIDSFKERLHQDAYASEFDILRVELYFLKDALFELEIYEITSDLDLANVSTIKVRNIHDYDSIILNHLISEEIETNIEDIPLHAYEDDDIDNDIKYNEVTKLIDAMLYLGVDIGSMDAFDMNTLDAETIQFVKLFDSIIINHMISEEVESNIDDIPLDAYEDEDITKDILDEELTRLIDVLIYLNIGFKVCLDSLDLDAIDSQSIKDIYSVYSIIINHMISNEIVAALDSIPLQAYIDGNADNDLADDEVLKLIEVLILLNVEINKLDSLNLEIVDANTLNTIHELDSVIMNHMISNEIKTSVDDIPNSAYIDQDPQNDVKPEEISKLIASLEILDEPISGLGTLKTNQLTFDKLSDIDALNSSIIDRLISNGLKDSTGHVVAESNSCIRI